MIAESSPSMEVRSGTVYFNAETQQPELRVGGIYYGPAGQQHTTSTALPIRRPNSAIPIVNPQVLLLLFLIPPVVGSRGLKAKMLKT